MKGWVRERFASPTAKGATPLVWWREYRLELSLLVQFLIVFRLMAKGYMLATWICTLCIIATLVYYYLQAFADKWEHDERNYDYKVDIADYNKAMNAGNAKHEDILLSSSEREAACVLTHSLQNIQRSTDAEFNQAFADEFPLREPE